MFVKPDNLHCIVFTSIKRSLGAAFPNGISRNKIERDERERLCQDCKKFQLVCQLLLHFIFLAI